MPNFDLKMTAKSALAAVGSFMKPTLGIGALKAVTREVRDNAVALGEVAQSTFTREKTSAKLSWLKDIADDRERFSSAMGARGVRDVDLPAIEKATRFRFNLWFIVAALAFGYSIAMLGGGHLSTRGLPAIVPAIWCLSFVAFLTAKAARASFDLYQLRLRALVPFSAWARDPVAWLGAKPSHGFLTTLLLLGVGAAVGYPESAVAQTMPSASDAMSWASYTFVAQDLSLQWIARLFPAGISAKLAGVAGVNPSSDSFSPLFMGFNSVLMAVGSSMLAFHTIVGAVSTAHEGKVLGQRWHTAWAPIRICIGVASLAPVSGGYCGAQLLAIQILLGGYGFADGIWTLYVNNMTSTTTATSVVPPPMNLGNTLIQEVLKAEVCWSAVKIKNGGTSGQAQLNQNPNNWLQRRFFGATPDAGATALPDAVQSASNGRYLWDYGRICGSIKLSPTKVVGDMPNNGSVAINQNNANTADANIAAGVPIPSVADLATPVDKFAADRMTAVADFITSVRSSGIVDNIINASVVDQNTNQPSAAAIPAQYDKIVVAANLFGTTIATNSKVLSDALNAAAIKAFRSKAIAMGWASAGSLNASIVEMSKVAIDIALGSMPDYSGINFDGVSADAQKELSRPISVASMVIAAQNSEILASGRVGTNDVSASAPSSSSTVDSVMAGLFNTGWLSRFSADISEVNPMDTLMQRGQTLLVSGEAAYIAVGLLRSTAWGADGATQGVSAAQLVTLGGAGLAAAAWKGLIETVVAVAIPISMGLIVVGVVESAILPMMPFVLWFYSVIGVAGFAVAFVVAAPLAAFMHIRMDGDELIGQQQKPFYSTLFQGALRPTLLLFGLIASNKVFAVMAGFLNATLGASIISAQNTHTSGLMINIGMEMFIAYLEYQLAVHSLEMVTKVPSMVAEMLGMKDIGGDEHRNATQIQGAIVSMANTQMGAGLGAGLKPPSSKDKAGDEPDKKVVKPVGKPSTEGTDMES